MNVLITIITTIANRVPGAGSELAAPGINEPLASL